VAICTSNALCKLHLYAGKAQLEKEELNGLKIEKRKTHRPLKSISRRYIARSYGTSERHT
jgi:hypothetical protein